MLTKTQILRTLGERTFLGALLVGGVVVAETLVVDAVVYELGFIPLPP